MARKAQANGTGKKKSAGRKSAAATERTAPRKAAAAPAETKRNRPQPHETAARLAALTRLKTESRRIAGEISALAAEGKKAGGAAYWKAIVKTHDLKKMDTAEARAELEALIEVAAQNEIRITWMGNQATFTDVMDQAQPPAKNLQGTRDLAAARAEADGFNSGKAGAMLQDNPHSVGTEEFVSWRDGWEEGEKIRRKKNPDAAARVAAAATADDSLPGEGEAKGTF
jgi:uncharacterized protein (UPF0335 family)